MSNPDRSVNSYIVSFPVGLLVLAIIIVLFQYKPSTQSFTFILWAGIPMLLFIIVFCVNLIMQYSACETTDAWKAMLGAFPSVFAVLFGLMISSFPICRIPVASVFTPLILGDNVDIISNQPKTKCCTESKVSIHKIESKFPIIEGISYGFYLMFATFFGITIGNSYATMC